MQRHTYLQIDLFGIFLKFFHSSSNLKWRSCPVESDVLLSYTLVLDEEVLWLLLDEEEKLLLVRRLLPPLRLIRGRLDGITARDRGGGGAGTRDGYEYILASKQKRVSNLPARFNTSYYGPFQKNHKFKKKMTLAL